MEEGGGRGGREGEGESIFTCFVHCMLSPGNLHGGVVVNKLTLEWRDGLTATTLSMRDVSCLNYDAQRQSDLNQIHLE